MITPTQEGLPLCRWCRRPVKGNLKNHENRCWWCDTCQDFIATDIARHNCTIPGPDTIACPICGRMTLDKNYLRHLRDMHKDLDTSQYRRRSESAKERDRRLSKEGQVQCNSINFLCHFVQYCNVIRPRFTCCISFSLIYVEQSRRSREAGQCQNCTQKSPKAFQSGGADLPEKAKNINVPKDKLSRVRGKFYVILLCTLLFNTTFIL